MDVVKTLKQRCVRTGMQIHNKQIKYQTNMFYSEDALSIREREISVEDKNTHSSEN